MEEVKASCRPKYTMRWLAVQTLFVFGISLILTVVAGGLDNLAHGRLQAGLLSGSCFSMISGSLTYCFALITITLLSLVLVEITFRKSVNFLQYALIGCALCLFYLLLIAMSEHMSFWLSYLVVSVMTVSLIAWFVKGITLNRKAVRLTTVILVAEYALILLLIYMGSLALLIGSLSLFGLIAVAMYFTLKLKLENEELVLK